MLKTRSFKAALLLGLLGCAQVKAVDVDTVIEECLKKAANIPAKVKKMPEVKRFMKEFVSLGYNRYNEKVVALRDEYLEKTDMEREKFCERIEHFIALSEEDIKGGSRRIFQSS